MSQQQNLPSWFPSSAEENAAAPSQGPEVCSVSELNRQIKQNIEAEFPLVYVQGEISNFTSHSSGHFYFSLKDKKSQISAVMFRGNNSRLKFRPETGMEVIVRARVSVYEPRGSYQLICENMEPVGAGALQKQFEQLKRKLSQEGLFSQEHKKKLPEFPKKIALVTSPTGAAVRDMLNVLSRRFKALEILIVPCQVQGDQASSQIIAAIELTNTFSDIDVMIVGRGGGSMEDLWAFNDEALARCIFASPIPIVSAVGHEIDFTIADFVADLRAPTPSAAAELVVKDSLELQQQVQTARNRLIQIQRSIFQSKKQLVVQTTKRLIDPKKQLQQKMQRLDDLLLRLERVCLEALRSFRHRVQLAQNSLKSPQNLLAVQKHELVTLEKSLRYKIEQIILTKRQCLKESARLLDSISPLRVLERGYSIVKSKDKVVTEVEQLKEGSEIQVKLFKGSFTANIKSLNRE